MNFFLLAQVVNLLRPQVVSLNRRDLVSLNRPRVVNFTGAYNLGATADAMQVAKSLHISESNATAFDAKQIRNSYSAVNKSMENYLYQKQKGVIIQHFLQKEK